MGNSLFVVALGLGTVFAGLIIIIVLCKLMSFFVTLTENKQSSPAPTVTPVSQSPVTNAPIADKQPLIAAISAVVAEELGTDISNIRIHSIKRV